MHHHHHHQSPRGGGGVRADGHPPPPPLCTEKKKKNAAVYSVISERVLLANVDKLCDICKEQCLSPEPMALIEVYLHYSNSTSCSL